MPDDDNKLTGPQTGELCLACGLCCTGLLHSWGDLFPEEVEAARRNGMLIQGPKGPAFPLPCPKFTNCCTIYPNRPRGCQAFKCALLRRVEAGHTSMSEGLAIVHEARRLVAEAEAATGPDQLIVKFRSAVAATEHSTVEKLKLTALALYLDKHFVLSQDGYFRSTRLVGAQENK